MDKVDTELKKQTFDGWMRGAAQMVVAASSMRILNVVDEEEVADMLARLSALIIQGATALGYNDLERDFPEFVRDLMGLHEQSIDSGQKMLADLREKVARIENGN